MIRLQPVDLGGGMSTSIIAHKVETITGRKTMSASAFIVPAISSSEVGIAVEKLYDRYALFSM